MSNAATFLAGKMKPEDWRGEWIGPDLFMEPQPGIGKAEGFLCKSKDQNEPCSVTIDLGHACSVDAVAVHPKRFKEWSLCDWISGWMFPLRYKIEISDNERCRKDRFRRRVPRLCARPGDRVDHPLWRHRCALV
jgi:hypothetical protein